MDTDVDPIVRARLKCLLGQVDQVGRVGLGVVEHHYSIVDHQVAVPDTDPDYKDLVDLQDYFAKHLVKDIKMCKIKRNRSLFRSMYHKAGFSGRTVDMPGDPL